MSTRPGPCSTATVAGSRCGWRSPATAGRRSTKAVTITPPSQVGAGATYVYPEIDAAGNVYVAVVSFPPNGDELDDLRRPLDRRRAHVRPVRAGHDAWTSIPTAALPNTRFRDGITESFAASPTYPDHLYLTYENWDALAGQMDVKFTQSTDGGQHWSTPVVVNDNVDMPGAPTDQFQPSVAAGPNGAVAVAFYDRRAACPNDPSVLPADVGRTNFCIDTSLQAYKDSGSGAVPVGGNVRISQFTLGSGAAGPASRRPLAVPVRRRQGPLPDRRRLHRRLLRARDLEPQHLRARRLDPLPLERDRRRRRPDLLPTASARHRAPHRLRQRLLTHEGPGSQCPALPHRPGLQRRDALSSPRAESTRCVSPRAPTTARTGV